MYKIFMRVSFVLVCEERKAAIAFRHLLSGVYGRGGNKPVVCEPGFFCEEGLAAVSKRSESRTTDGRKVNLPSAARIRLNMRAAANGKLAQVCQLDRFAVNTADIAARRNHKLHGYGL